MDTGKNKTKDTVLKELGVFRTAHAVGVGVSQPTLSRMAASGKIVRIEHGLYFHPEAEIDPTELDFAIACTKLGDYAMVGGLSALFRYGLTQQAPDQIWMVVPSSVKTNNKLYRCLRTKNDFTIGVDHHRSYLMTNLERTLIEALQFATKIGLETAISALRRALKQGMTTEKKLHAMAEQLGALGAFKKHWEAIVAE